MAIRSRNNTLGLEISSPLLGRACQRFTELLLLCLPQANKVTLYLVGPLPHLKITRMGMAARNRETDEILRHAPSKMDSEVCGKTWKDIRGSTADALGALTFCLRNQRTCTSSGLKDDSSKEAEESSEKVLANHLHFQPVLMQKADLWHSMPPPSVYPKDRNGKPLWLKSDYVTVALIKINLNLESSPFDQTYCQVTEELTRTLAIQFLQLHSKESLLKEMEVIQEEKDELREILITQIRKIMSRLGLIYRVIDNELAHLRQSWENLIYEYHPKQPSRSNVLKQLNLLLNKLTADNNVVAESKIVQQLEWYQNKLAESCFLPEENEVWFKQRILPLWKNTASRFNSAPKIEKQMKKLFSQLEQSFYVGVNKTLIDTIDDIPNSIKAKWITLAYNKKDLKKVDLLEEYTRLLEEVYIDFPNKRKTLENLVCLRKLVVYLEDLEKELDIHINKYQDFAFRNQISLH